MERMHSRSSTTEHDSSVKEVIKKKKKKKHKQHEHNTEYTNGVEMKHRKHRISAEKEDVVEHIKKKHKCDVFDDMEGERCVKKHKHHLHEGKSDDEVNKHSGKHRESGLLYFIDLGENRANIDIRHQMKPEVDTEECEDSEERIHKAKKKHKKKQKHTTKEKDKQNLCQPDHINEKQKKKKKHLINENQDTNEQDIEHEQIIIEDENIYEGMEIIKKKYKKKQKDVAEGDQDNYVRGTVEDEEIDEGVEIIKKKHKKRKKSVMERDQDTNDTSTVADEEIDEGMEIIKKKHKKKHKKDQKSVMERDQDTNDISTVEDEDIDEGMEIIKKKHKKDQKSVIEGDQDTNDISTVEDEEINGMEIVKKKKKKKHRKKEKRVMEEDQDTNDKITVENEDIDEEMQSTSKKGKKKDKKKHKHRIEEIESISLETESAENCSDISISLPQAKQKTSPCGVLGSHSKANDDLPHSSTSDVIIVDDDDSKEEVNEFKKEWTEKEEELLQANWDSYFQKNPCDEPEHLLVIPSDMPLAEKQKLWKIRKETKFFESLATGLNKPLAAIRNKAEKMFIREQDKTPKRHSTLNRWSAEEIKQLEYNWANYFRDHPMPEPYDLLAPKHVLEKSKRAKLMKYKRETRFMERLREGINRTALSVYHEAKRHFNPFIEVTGKLDEEELSQLKKLIATHGKKLLFISTLMGRSPACIEAHFKLLEREAKKCNTGKWSAEEEKRLSEAIQEQVGFDVTEKKSLHNKNRFNNINWPEVAEKVQTRHFHQCFHKWMYDLSSKVVSGVRCRPSLVEGMLVELIKQQNVKENSDIDWMALYEQFNNVPSPSYLKWLFGKICREHVPNLKNRSLEDTLSLLSNVYAKPNLKVYN